MHHRFILPVSIVIVAAAASLVAAQSGQGRGQGQGQGRGGPPPRGGFSVERLMEMDVNGDGKLSQDEVPQRLAERLFADADSNGDGFLDKEELDVFFAERGFGRARGERQGAGGVIGEGAGAGGGRSRRAGGSRAGAGFEPSMKAAGRAMRSLSKSTFDSASQQEDLQRVGALQAAFVGAKSSLQAVKMSEQAKAQFGDDVTAYRRAFRLQLITALTESIKLEQAIIEGDSRAATASVKQLTSTRDRGHDLFQSDHDHDEDGDDVRKGRETR